MFSTECPLSLAHRGKCPPYWLEKRDVARFGKWDKIVVVFGYLDNKEGCRYLLALLLAMEHRGGPLDPKPYRCVEHV